MPEPPPPGPTGGPPDDLRPGRRRIAAVRVATAVVIVAVVVVAASILVPRGDRRGSTVDQVVAASRSSCALLNGTVWCWGSAGDDEGRPSRVLESVVQLSGGGDSFCAITDGAELRCWGDGPIGAPALTGVSDVAVASDHACALIDDGSVWCWGDGAHGELGGDTGAPGKARRVELPRAVEVAVAPDRSCAVLSDGTVSCWGDNRTGQLGSATTARGSARPVVVEGVSGATRLAMGTGHTCAVVAERRVLCWGDNRRGQLGTGEAVATRLDPGHVVDIRGVTSISAGPYSTCAVDDADRAVCWGDGTFGQLGDGRRSDPRRQPVRVKIGSRATDVAVGDFHACGLFPGGADGPVRCWGANGSGQLGRPGPPSDVPRGVPAGG